MDQKSIRIKARRAWENMRQRCRPDGHPKNVRYYFDRGITVCARWEHSFQAFVDDVGLPSRSDDSLDRIDSLKGYNPDNCQWIPISENRLKAVMSRKNEEPSGDLYFMLSKEEHGKLKAAASAIGLPLTQWIRMVALQAASAKQ